MAAVEQNSSACDTYRHNLVRRNSPRLFEVDIATLDPAKVSKCFVKTECDLVLGGPPCQGFSVHRINDAGKNDPRNELIHRYFEFVSVLKPRIFLLENVPGLMWPRHEKALKKFYAEAKLAGYNVMPPEILDARDYGLPQRRKRVFILGLRNDIPAVPNWAPAPTHGSARAVLNDSRLKLWAPCTKVFKKRVRKADPNDVHMKHSKKLISLFQETPKNGGSRSDTERVLPCHENHNGHTDVYGRIDPSKPAPTMTTACINPSKGRFVHPTRSHGITLRQAARIQTFPDWFEFKGGLMAGGVQIGNAVPVKLGEILLRRVANILDGQQARRDLGTGRSRPILEAAE